MTLNTIRRLHRAFNVVVRRVHGTYLQACNGDECSVCQQMVEVCQQMLEVDVRDTLRQQVLNARQQFITDAEDVVQGDPQLAAVAWGMIFTVGEVWSSRAALDALMREKYRRV